MFAHGTAVSEPLARPFVRRRSSTLNAEIGRKYVRRSPRPARRTAGRELAGLMPQTGVSRRRTSKPYDRSPTTTVASNSSDVMMRGVSPPRATAAAVPLA